MSLLTEFRQAVAAQLSDELGIPFKDGMTRGPIEGKSMGFTATVRVAENPDIVSEGIELHVAVYRAFQQRKSNEDVIDPGPFEDLIEQVQAISANHQAEYGPWFWRVTEAVPDYDKGCVDFLVYATADNVATARA